MKKIVILAEKPNQAKAYAEAFQVEKRESTYIKLKPSNIFKNAEVYITWGIGHLVELKQPGEYKEEWEKWNLDSLPIIPSRFEYKVAKDKSVQFNAVKKLFYSADILINACDIDREGSNIFYSILKMTGVKNKEIKRLWINSLEVDEIRKGFMNLKNIEQDLKMYEEANARQIGDWLVGINSSRLYTIYLRKKGINETLSVGRVQSPLVYMIYQRQKEIENFKPEKFYEVFAKFKSENGEYQGKSQIKAKDKKEIERMILKNNIILNESTEGTVKKIEKKLKKETPPLLHSLSTLQTVANKKYKYSPSTVLDTVQSLYEKRLVTYPRTDCNYITESEFKYLCENIDNYKNILKIKFDENTEMKKRYVDNSKVQEHYAIIPTKTMDELLINKLSDVEKTIFFEILKTTLAMFHSDYIYEETSIITDVNSVEFLTRAKVEIEKGFKSLFESDTNDTVDTSDSSISNDTFNTNIPRLNEGDIVGSEVFLKEGITKFPKPFTEGQLINLMKTAGKTIEDKEESEILKEVEGIGTEATRSGIIETIKKNGYIEIKKNVVSITEKGRILCGLIEGSLLSSASMTAKWEAYLKKISKGEGTKDNFVKNINKFVNHLLEEVPKKFENESVIDLIVKKKETEFIGDCPVCKEGKMVDHKTFIGCSEYKSGCNFSINKIIAEKKLTDKNIRDLLEKGKTSKIKGFKSKKGNKFDATLIIKDNKVTFDFS